jgi:hypothetical protein
MAFSIVAHRSRGPISWGPYASRDEAERRIYERWAEKIPGVGRLTPWEIVGDPPGPGTFTVWKQDPEAGRQWRVVWPERTHEHAKEIARDFRRAKPFWAHSPQRTVILPDGAPPPPREPACAIEVRAPAFGHAGWERTEAGMSARGARAKMKALRWCCAHACDHAGAARAVREYLNLRGATPNDLERAEVRARELEPFAIEPGRRYRVLRSDGSGRWKYGEIGRAIPHDFDKYDVQLVLERPALPPLRENASMIELLDRSIADPVFYFYRDDIEPVPGPRGDR